MRISDITGATKMWKELTHLEPRITLRKLPGQVMNTEVWTFSETNFNIVTGRSYGQTGIITEIMVTND